MTAGLLPRAVPLVQALLPTVTTFSALPSDYLNRMPCIYVTARGGLALGPNLDMASGVPIQLDAYAATPTAAQLLCAQAFAALVAAWRAHTRTDGGVINRITSPVPPFEVRVADQPDSFARFTCTASLDIR